MLGYSMQNWGKLHALVTDDSIREMFWMLLRSRNVSHIHPGTAPENDFMATAVAQSAPEAISYLKHLRLAVLECPQAPCQWHCNTNRVVIPTISRMLSSFQDLRGA